MQKMHLSQWKEKRNNLKAIQYYTPGTTPVTPTYFRVIHCYYNCSVTYPRFDTKAWAEVCARYVRPGQRLVLSTVTFLHRLYNWVMSGLLCFNSSHHYHVLNIMERID